jgi:hypothetical protein
MSAAPTQMPPPPSPGERPAPRPLPYKPTRLLPFLSIAVLFAGVGGSAVAGWLWPLDSSGNEISLFYVVLDPGAPGAVFNLPLFMLGAGPSLVASAALGGAASIVEELRRRRAGW